MSRKICVGDFARTDAFVWVESTIMVPDFIRPLSKACWIVSLNISSRISSVIRVFLNFVRRLGSIIFASGSRSRKNLYAISVWALLIRVSSDRSYSFFKNSSLNIISGSFAGRPKFSQYCLRNIGFIKLKSMFSFIFRKRWSAGMIAS